MFSDDGLEIVSFSLIRDVYRCARSSDWGDQLPLVQKVEEDVQSDSECWFKQENTSDFWNNGNMNSVELIKHLLYFFLFLQELIKYWLIKKLLCGYYFNKKS